MTISAAIQSLLSSTAGHEPPGQLSPEQHALYRWMDYRKYFAMTEIALPAGALGVNAIARWVRDEGLRVDVRTRAELAAAIGVGIHPKRMTVFADTLGDAELRRISPLGVGRVVVSSTEQIEALASPLTKRKQAIFVRMSDVNAPGGADPVDLGLPFGTDEADNVVRTVIADDRLALVGLHCDVGVHEHDFISYPAATGNMIAEMTQIWRRHRVLVARLGLGGLLVSGPSLLSELASDIDESLEDACIAMRFPRPIVVLSPAPEIVGKRAA